MVAPILTAEEVQALRGAVAKPNAPRSASARTATPIALIAEQRAGEAARPASLRIASRWAALIRSRIAHAMGVRLEVQVANSDAVHPPILKETLATSWTALAEVAGRPGLAAIAVSGPVIEWMAAQLLGGAPELAQPRNDRPPSRTALNVFARGGELIVKALIDAWREEQNAEVEAVTDPSRASAIRFALADFETSICVTLEIAGQTSGTIRMISKPETLVAPAPAMKVAPISRARFENAVAAVPVEVRVELGRASIRMSELKALKPGALITLGQPTDALLPVSCSGVVKAHGRPAVSRGALAIEIVSGPSTQGNKK